MNGVRLWIGLLALVCFLAGISSGFVLAGAARETPRSGEPFEEFRTQFAQRFELDAPRIRLFGDLLRNYQREIEDARTAMLRSRQTELDERLGQIAGAYRDHIRNHVLPPERRAEFDRLADEWQTIQ